MKREPLLRIDPEFATLIPPLSQDERTQLEANLKAEGCRDSLVVWQQEDILLDGHNRYAICQAHNLEFDACHLSFDSRDEAKAWIIHNQFGRRNLTPFVRGELALVLEPLIAEKAKVNQAQAGENYGVGQKLSTILPEAIDTRKEVAAAAHLSEGTIHKVRVIAEKADEDTKEQLRAGDKTIHEVYKKVNPHIAQASGEDEWYTPEKYIEAAKKVMGDIDLDPASSPMAQEHIQAKTYYTEQQNGLTKPWTGRLWLNPPYDQPLISEFIVRLMDLLSSSVVSEAILLTNNSTDTKWFHTAEKQAARICFTHGRIRFESPIRKTFTPLQGQAFFYFGSNMGCDAPRRRPIAPFYRS